jgi:hypothetical protein
MKLSVHNVLLYLSSKVCESVCLELCLGECVNFEVLGWRCIDIWEVGKTVLGLRVLM